MRRNATPFRGWLIISLVVVAAPALCGFAIPVSAAGPAASSAASSTSSTKGSSAIQDLKNPNPDKRAKAATELGKMGDPKVVPALAAALNDSSPKVRRQVVIAVASYRTPQSLDALIKATMDNDEETRWLAVKGIEGYYTGSSPKGGVFGFMERQYHRAKEVFVQNSVRVSPGTAIDPQAVSALDRTMMDTRFPKAAREATVALGILQAKAAIRDLVKTAHSGDEDLAREALNSLAKLQDTSAGPQLIDLLDSSNTNIQQDAAVTVGILRTRSAVPKLQTMYQNSPKKETREKALKGLAYIGDPVSEPIFLKALYSSDSSVRTYAAEGLARTKGKQGLTELLRVTPAEKNESVKLAMEFGVTSLGRDDYLSSIIKQLSSGDADAAQAYLVELTRDSNMLSKLYPYMNSSDSDVRRRLCNVLMYSGDHSSLQPLERASHDKNSDVASAALNAMRSVRIRISSATR